MKACSDVSDCYASVSVHNLLFRAHKTLNNDSRLTSDLFCGMFKFAFVWTEELFYQNELHLKDRQLIIHDESSKSQQLQSKFIQ